MATEGRSLGAPHTAIAFTAARILGAMVLIFAPGACDTQGHPEHDERLIRTGIGAPPADTTGGVLVTPQRIAKGKTLFQGRCGSCHGPDASGRIGMGPALASKSFLEAANDEMLLTTIRKGRPGTTMVPWDSAMSRDEIEEVVAFLRSTVEHEAVELNEAPLEGSAEQGEKLYRAICASCHGSSGAGYSENSSGTGIGRKAFLDVASNGYIRHVVKHGKSGTKMRPFDDKAPAAVANLSEVEIDSVIAYLRQRAW